MKILFTLIHICLLQGLYAQYREFRYGLIGKMEFNRLKIENSENRPEVVYESGAKPAEGIYAAINLRKHWFMDASVLLSRAKYTADYTRAGSTFIDADIRFTQCNLNLNLVLNPDRGKVQVFLFGGGQLLYRRWGEERYINDIVSRSYWPSTRVMAQAGIGFKCAVGRNYYLQPFAGLRYAADQQLVYDASVNQVFAGLVICHGIKGKKKNRYSKCPVEF